MKKIIKENYITKNYFVSIDTKSGNIKLTKKTYADKKAL